MYYFKVEVFSSKMHLNIVTAWVISMCRFNVCSYSICFQTFPCLGCQHGKPTQLLLKTSPIVFWGGSTSNPGGKIHVFWRGYSNRRLGNTVTCCLDASSVDFLDVYSLKQRWLDQLMRVIQVLWELQQMMCPFSLIYFLKYPFIYLVLSVCIL